MSERLGQPLMPWQRLIADVGGELDPDTGLPAYREVIVTVPRQSGKTTLVLAWEVQRALGWGSAQRIVYSAQSGNDARKKLVEDQIPILDPRRKQLGIRQILKGMGNEAIAFRNGSRIVLMANTEESGHGKTIDLGIKDELFADVDDRRDQALIPAMATRQAAQILTTSTMGTDESAPLNRAVARGRQAVDDGLRSGVAYFEWSADPEADADDPDVWWSCMPALGFTQPESSIAHARASMPDGEFRRAFLNVATRNDERLIPAVTWDLVCSPDARPEGRLTFGIDVNPERSASAVVAVADGVAEVVDHRPGVGWLTARCVELNERWGSPAWAADGSPSAPVSSVLPELERLGLTVERLEGGRLAAACGDLFDSIAERGVQFRRHPSLDAAVAGVTKRQVGDGWVWARRGVVDIAPFMAATVALWAAANDGGGQLLW